MPSRARRTLFSLVIFFATCGLIGMMIDQKVGAQSSTDESTFRDNLRSFTNVYDIVAENYAEPLTGDKPEKGHLRRGHPGHAAYPRSPLQLLRPQSLRQDARRAARQVLRRRDDHPAAGRRIGAEDRRRLPL